MAQLECESHSLDLLYIDLFTTIFNREMFHFQEAVKETISNNNHMCTSINISNFSSPYSTYVA